MKEQIIEKFMKECGVDMKDFETAGVFPYYNSKKQKWTSISRGAAWRMYAEWLENKLADHLTAEQELTDKELTDDEIGELTKIADRNLFVNVDESCVMTCGGIIEIIKRYNEMRKPNSLKS